MKRLLFIIVLVILAGIGMLLAQGQSYLTLSYAHWAVQIQLWVIIFALLALVVIYKLLSTSCHWLCHLPQRWQNYWNTRRSQHAQAVQQSSAQALQELTEVTDLTELKNRWHKLPKRWRQQPEFALTYVRMALRYDGDPANDNSEAATIIESQLAHQWQDQWINYYGLLSQQAEKRLKHVHQWLQTRPHDALLLLTAGRLAMSAEQWGKAEQFLQQSITQQPSVAAYLELALVQQQLGKTEMAWRSYQAAHMQERGQAV